MAGKNYKIGRTFEYRVQNYLRKIGYYVNRSYASKGLYDLIAIPNKFISEYKYPKKPLLIQCKSNGYIHPTELENLKKTTSGRELQLLRIRRIISYCLGILKEWR